MMDPLTEDAYAWVPARCLDSRITSHVGISAFDECHKTKLAKSDRIDPKAICDTPAIFPARIRRVKRSYAAVRWADKLASNPGLTIRNVQSNTNGIDPLEALQRYCESPYCVPSPQPTYSAAVTFTRGEDLL